MPEETTVDFSKPSQGLVKPYFPGKNAAPAEDDVPAGADWFAWDPVIGPADGGGRSSPNPMSIIGPSAAMPSLAARLSWRTAGDRRQ